MIFTTITLSLNAPSIEQHEPKAKGKTLMFVWKILAFVTNPPKGLRRVTC